MHFCGYSQWGDYNYDYDEKSLHNSRRYDFSPKHYRFIKLIWSEQDKTAEYTLKFNGTKRGLWIGTEPPRGKARQKRDLCCLHPLKWVRFNVNSVLGLLFGRQRSTEASLAQPLLRNGSGHEGGGQSFGVNLLRENRALHHHPDPDEKCFRRRREYLLNTQTGLNEAEKFVASVEPVGCFFSGMKRKDLFIKKSSLFELRSLPET